LTPEEFEDYVTPPCARCGSTGVTTDWNVICDAAGVPQQYVAGLMKCHNPECPTNGGVGLDPFGS
jgi:hypothetical protein